MFKNYEKWSSVILTLILLAKVFQWLITQVDWKRITNWFARKLTYGGDTELLTQVAKELKTVTNSLADLKTDVHDMKSNMSDMKSTMSQFQLNLKNQHNNIAQVNDITLAHGDRLATHETDIDTLMYQTSILSNQFNQQMEEREVKNSTKIMNSTTTQSFQSPALSHSDRGVPEVRSSQSVASTLSSSSRSIPLLSPYRVPPVEPPRQTISPGAVNFEERLGGPKIRGATHLGDDTTNTSDVENNDIERDGIMQNAQTNQLEELRRLHQKSANDMSSGMRLIGLEARKSNELKSIELATGFIVTHNQLARADLLRKAGSQGLSPGPMSLGWVQAAATELGQPRNQTSNPFARVTGAVETYMITLIALGRIQCQTVGQAGISPVDVKRLDNSELATCHRKTTALKRTRPDANYTPPEAKSMSVDQYFGGLEVTTELLIACYGSHHRDSLTKMIQDMKQMQQSYRHVFVVVALHECYGRIMDETAIAMSRIISKINPSDSKLSMNEMALKMEEHDLKYPLLGEKVTEVLDEYYAEATKTAIESILNQQQAQLQQGRGSVKQSRTGGDGNDRDDQRGRVESIA
jgi:hypothetical protein